MPEQLKTTHLHEIVLNFFHHRWPRITTDIFVRNLCISEKSVVDFFEEGVKLIKRNTINCRKKCLGYGSCNDTANCRQRKKTETKKPPPDPRQRGITVSCKTFPETRYLTTCYLPPVSYFPSSSLFRLRRFFCTFTLIKSRVTI